MITCTMYMFTVSPALSGHVVSRVPCSPVHPRVLREECRWGHGQGSWQQPHVGIRSLWLLVIIGFVITCYNQWSPLGQHLSACPNIAGMMWTIKSRHLGGFLISFYEKIFQLIKINWVCQNFYLYVIHLRNQNMGVFIANCKDRFRNQMQKERVLFLSRMSWK